MAYTDEEKEKLVKSLVEFSTETMDMVEKLVEHLEEGEKKHASILDNVEEVVELIQNSPELLELDARGKQLNPRLMRFFS